VWQQKLDLADPKITVKEAPVAHRHTIVLPVQVPALGAGVLYVRPGTGAELKPAEAPWLARISSAAGEWRVQSFRLPADTRWADAHLKPDSLSALTAADLPTDTACELLLRYDAATQRYSGGAGDGCSRRVTMQLSATQWLLLDQPKSAPAAAIPQRSRKVRYFDGWVWFRNAGPGAAADDKDTSFTAKISLHTEGQRITLMRKDGSESPWALELATLTYQNTRRPVLKLGLVERASGKTISYTWSNVGALMLGMNLQWFQAGVTQRAEGRADFGF
jgi:hypothetical protein